VLRLHVVPAQGAPFDHELRADSLVIGRSSSADLALPDRFLSRHHARLYRAGDRYLLEDLGSRNGTLLNGEPVLAPTAVGPGDVIRISSSVLAVQGDAGDAVDEALASSHTVFRPVAELLAQSRAAAPTDHRDLERYAARLRLVNEVHQALGSALALPELLQLILDRLFDHLGPDQAGIYLLQDDRLQLAASRSAGGGTPRLGHSQALLREVTGKRVAALVLDAQTDSRFAAAHSLLAAGVRSLVAAPLLADDGSALGLVMVHCNAAVRLFTEEDMELLVSLASVAAVRLRNVALAEEAAQRRVLEEELALARRIQERLLPRELPPVPGWSLHAHNAPSRHVSGDLFQAVTPAAGGRCSLLIADVAGKGVAASLLAASVEALAAGALEDGLPPAEACARVSRLLYQRTPGEKYATALLVAIAAHDGRLEYANAGHNPGLLVRAGGEVERLGPTGVPLGLLPVAAYRGAHLELAAGDTVVLYTDGITEAVNEEEEELGLDRLTTLCRERRGDDLPALAAAIERAVLDFSGDGPRGDDQTLLLLRREGD
jgi:serine phosphatase RsbU (regulator of sigma subunit)